MNKLLKDARHSVKTALIKAHLNAFQTENGSGGVEFILKTKEGNYHELYLQAIDLDKDRSVKIPKNELGTLKENLWIALVLFMKDMEPVIYLIPSKTFETTDNYIFFENNQPERFSHLSNWEIRVFTKAIPELSRFTFNNMIGQL